MFSNVLHGTIKAWNGAVIREGSMTRRWFSIFLEGMLLLSLFYVVQPANATPAYASNISSMTLNRHFTQVEDLIVYELPTATSVAVHMNGTISLLGSETDVAVNEFEALEAGR